MRSPEQQLIHMANQIATNNENHRTEEEAVVAVATHMKKFWARSMKQDIVDYLNSGGTDLHPISRLAVERMQQM